MTGWVGVSVFVHKLMEENNEQSAGRFAIEKVAVMRWDDKTETLTVVAQFSGLYK